MMPSLQDRIAVQRRKVADINDKIAELMSKRAVEESKLGELLMQRPRPVCACKYFNSEIVQYDPERPVDDHGPRGV
jgi:hypothetical protein